MPRLILSEKRIINLAIVLVLVSFVSWLFIYIPTTRAARRLKSQLSSVESQIQAIKGMMDKTPKIGEGIKLLEQRSQQLESKFPREKEESVKLLSDLALKLGIDITSVRLQDKTPFFDENNQKVIVGGKACQKLPVAIEMRCDYKSLVDYLQALIEQVPAYISIEKLKINKESTDSPKLSITIELNLFILS